jgi:hypothetical protein
MRRVTARRSGSVWLTVDRNVSGRLLSIAPLDPPGRRAIARSGALVFDVRGRRLAARLNKRAAERLASSFVIRLEGDPVKVHSFRGLVEAGEINRAGRPTWRISVLNEIDLP